MHKYRAVLEASEGLLLGGCTRHEYTPNASIMDAQSLMNTGFDIEVVLGQRCVWQGGVLMVVGKVTGKALPVKMRGGLLVTLNKRGEGTAARVMAG